MTDPLFSDGHEPLPPEFPGVFSRLAPFSGWLERGGGALMYHKLGPRPAGVRLKGLYVSVSLFQKQLGDLRSAGYRSADLAELTQAVPGERRIALTFDDGFENVLRNGLDPLRTHGLRAIQFLVPGLVGRTNEWEQREGEATERLMDWNQIREWLAAGHDVGAHTCTHPRLSRIPRDQAREEIFGSKARLEDALGRPIRHFCYPFGDWNPAVRDLVQEAGFVTACTTEAGMNRPGGDVFRLRRLTARYVSLNWRNVGRILRQWVSGRG
ncbi:MAG: polysaccharide deacetylase family protein [Verrucomicrobia bacterium]|nr:polysaccharide deacetylase family protein [Verrucomicrobiota bacterium]